MLLLFRVGMAEWLLVRAKHNRSGSDLFRLRLLANSSAAADTLIAGPADDDFLHMKLLDPLANWFKHQKSDVSSRMMARIQNLVGAICAKIKWSLLNEPGRPSTDLSVGVKSF